MIYPRRSTDVTQVLMWAGVVAVVVILLIAAFGSGRDSARS